MNQLLAEVIDAHGGMDRWTAYQKVEASFVSVGGLFALKGVGTGHNAPPRDGVAA